MSKLLDDIIATRNADAIEYEEYLRRIAELARQVEAGLADDTPDQLKSSPTLRALYNNLKSAVGAQTVFGSAEEPNDFTVSGDPVLKKALEIDSKIKRERPDNWRGVRAREQVIKGLLYEKLQDKDAVERIFPIIKAQAEY